MFDIFYINKDRIQENKNYYKNVLVKIKNEKNIFIRLYFITEQK